MTPKQALWAHIRAHHSKLRWPGTSATYAQLQRWHANEHYRYSPNHHHGGPGTALDRPVGWYTGENAVPNVPAFSKKSSTTLRNDVQ